MESDFKIEKQEIETIASTSSGVIYVTTKKLLQYCSENNIKIVDLNDFMIKLAKKSIREKYKCKQA